MAERELTNGHGNPHVRRVPVKTPSVLEALPYTPFTSILPYDATVVPAPTCSDVSSIMSLTAEHRAGYEARRLLEKLSEGADRAENASERCQQTLSDVKRLLQTSTTSYFTFRKPMHHGIASEKSVPLSSFAQAVLELPVFDAKQSDPDTIHVQQRQAQPAKSQISQKLAKSSHTTQNLVPTPHRTVGVSAATHSTKSTVIDEKAKGDQVVRELKSLLASILSEEQSNSTSLNHFIEVDTIDGLSLQLSPASQSKLDAAMRRVDVQGRMGDLSVSELRHAQRLCEPFIKRSVTFEVPSNPSEESLDEWLQQLGEIDRSFVALRILLRTMTGGVSELRSEYLLRTIVECIKRATETFVTIAETRPRADDKETAFAIARPHDKQLHVVLQDFGKALRLLKDLLAEVELDESAVSGIMYACRALLFAENATADKESLIGVQNYEAVRKLAMDVVIALFERHPSQQDYIVLEIITSLEKLPATKQAARQYKLQDGRPIQLVTALFMRLIQTIAGREVGNGQQQAEEAQELAEVERATRLAARLQLIIQPGEKATRRLANVIIRSFAQKASSVSKSSDEPFRKQLDNFVEDLLNVMGLPEWPAAELLLEYLFGVMCEYLRPDLKFTVPQRNFALDLLGRLGTGMLSLRLSLRNASSDSEQVTGAIQMAQDNDKSIAVPLRMTLTSNRGIYHGLLRHIHEQDNSYSIDYHKLRWAQIVKSLLDKHLESLGDIEQPPTSLAELLTSADMMCELLTDNLWFERDDTTALSSQNTALAAKLLLISKDWVRTAADVVASRLYQSMRGDHVTERGQALRAMASLLEADPSMIEQKRTILNAIVACMDDESPLVRDAAMDLLTKCMEQLPKLGALILSSVEARCRDRSKSVRKRAVKMLKGIFGVDKTIEDRVRVLRTLIDLTEDAEESVNQAACHALSELLFITLNPTSGVDRSGNSLAVLLVAIIDVAAEGDDEQHHSLADKSADAIAKSLVKFFRAASDTHANALAKLTDALFDGVITPDDFSIDARQDMLLQMIAIIAEASPKALEPKQLLLLEPYLSNLTNEDLPVFRSALSVLRYGISRSQGLSKDFLTGVQRSLMKNLAKLSEREITSVAICLSVVSQQLDGSAAKVVQIHVNALAQLKGMSTAVVGPDQIRRAQRLCSISGQLGQACDFEPFIDRYGAISNNSKSVTRLSVELYLPFVKRNQPMEVRQAAIAAICAVAQRSPAIFQSHMALFDQIIKEHERLLVILCLEGMLSFFKAQEVDKKIAEGHVTGRDRLASTYVATAEDGAAAGLSQHFLPLIIELALGSTDQLGLVATELMASITEQGLPHPKECGPPFVTLETSPNQAIATIAAEQHRMLHDKHESILEKEYVRAMDLVLKYQLDTVHDSTGYTGQTAKLHHFWKVLKAGKAKVRQKFLTSICQRMGFELGRLPPRHMEFTRFMIENLAMFEYDKLEDLRIVAEHLGLVFAGAGASVAQEIDSTLNHLSVNAMNGDLGHQQTVSKAQLQALGSAAQILLLLSEGRDQLVRVWGGKILKKDKGKAVKPPARHSNTASLTEEFLTKTASLVTPLDNEGALLAICQKFSEVMTIDSEAKVASDDDEADADGSDESVSPRKKAAGPGTPSKRKRKSVERQNEPRKRPRDKFRRSASAASRGTNDQDSDGDWA